MRWMRPKIAQARIVLASLGAVGCLVACTALSSDFDGFTSGADGLDSGPDGTTPTGQDANVVGETDATPNLDAGSDGDAADTNPCVVPGMTTRICDDFERSMGVLMATSSPENWTNNGSVVFANDSAGPGQVASFAAGTDAGTTDSFLSFQAGDVRRATIRAHVNVLSAGDPGRQIMIVKFTGSSMTAQVTVSARPNGGLALFEQIISAGGANHTLSSLTPGWHRLALDVDLVQNEIAFTIDGTSALPQSETFPILPNFPSTAQVTLSIGARYSGGTPLTEVQFDDVLLATATQ